jgi:WD40 repeat protein
MDRKIMLWDNSRSVPDVLLGHRDGVGTLAFSHDGSLLASAADRMIVLWEMQPGRPLGTELVRRTGEVLRDLAASPDGVFALASDHEILLANAATGKLIGEPIRSPRGFFKVAFDPPGRRLATVGSDGAILWTLPARTRRVLDDSHRSVDALAFSPDGATLASGAQNGEVTLWDATAGTPRGPPFRAGDRPVSSLAFSPDNKALASADWNDRVVLWTLRDRPPASATREEVGRGKCVAFSPDGKFLALCDGDAVTLWDVATRTDVAIRTRLAAALSGHPGATSAIAFSPDGKTIAVGTEHGIVLWDAATRARFGAILDGHVGTVKALAFSRDGKRLVSAGGITAMAWDIDLATWQRRACRVANRGLTEAERRQFLPDEPYLNICPVGGLSVENPKKGEKDTQAVPFTDAPL